MTPTPPFRLLVTGARTATRAQAAMVRRTLDRVCDVQAPGRLVVLVHGAAPGVDAAARHWADERWNADAEAHPADWRARGKAAGPVRNGEMVATRPDLCVAFPNRDSRGTWDCIRQAAAAGIPVWIYPLEES